MADKKYNVVFEYTAEAGGYAGVRTWTSLKSKEDFVKWYTPELAKRERVLAEGVTEREAIDICNGTSFESDLAACLQDATNPRTGALNPAIFTMKLTSILMARPRTSEEVENALEKTLKEAEDDLKNLK